MWKNKIIKSIKIALAAVLSIAIAGKLGLQYSATAGIITVLSIQNTKRETLKSARNRGIAFLCAMVLAYFCYQLFGYTLLAFGIYLFLFAMLCLTAGWTEALSMVSVLISHFLIEQSMEKGLVINEVLVFVIGAGMGILVNLHLHKKESRFQQLADEVDKQIKEILHCMSLWLPKEDKSTYENNCFLKLQQALKEAELCASANYNNVLLKTDTSELDYIHMREKQSLILEEIYENIKYLEYLPKQAKEVAQLFAKIEQGYHKDNTVEGLLLELDNLFKEMKQQKLPQNREEFEARAILFYILMQLKKLLELKREFVLQRER